jgi:hypothetical protein
MLRKVPTGVLEGRCAEGRVAMVVVADSHGQSDPDAEGMQSFTRSREGPSRRVPVMVARKKQVMCIVEFHSPSLDSFFHSSDSHVQSCTYCVAINNI